jgi:hypothetical protein
MEKNNYNLENRINILYEYLYNPNNKKCFSIDKIILGEISLDDIKISLPSNTEKEYYDVNKSEILNGNFKLLFFNEESLQLIFKKYSNNLSINIKISFYKNDKIDLLESPINNDSLFSYLLSYLVLSNKTKHILLPIINLDIKFSEIENLIIEDIYKTKIKSEILNNKISDICCLQVREHFFKTINLQDYLATNKCSYKILLFHIIHTLATIEMKFKGFKHNNLLLRNIFVYLKNKSDSFIEYEFKDVKYYIPDIDIDIKITNFEYSYIPKYYGKDKSGSDILTFINDLKLSNIKTDCNKETHEFFEDIKKNSDIIDLLNNKYFSIYLKKPSNNEKPKEILSNEKTREKINTFMDSDNYSQLGNQEFLSNTNIMINKRIIKEQKNLQDKRTIRNQIGGNKPEIAPYKGEKNNPFISNEERKINEKRYNENPVREPPVLLEQKIYDTAQKSQPPSQFPPTYVPIYSAEGEISNQMLPYSKVLNQPPVQKVYNISLTNPLMGHTVLNKVYEDMLPSDPRDFTSKTIYERNQLIDFFRNCIIENCDGEEMTVVGGKNSLLSYIKIMDINPYSVKTNPYTNLPRNFLLYRAGYPVRLDEKTLNKIGLAKNAMGINVRIYMLSEGDLRCKIINNLINADDFDVWRDIKYYDWVKNIVKRKVSPNFVCPILYKIDTQSKIEWGRLETIKSQNLLSGDIKKLKENQSKINDKHDLLIDQFLPYQFRNSLHKKCDDEKKTGKTKEDITINSGKSLIMLTEAPTSSIHQWSSLAYKSFGSQKKMVSSGYHSPNVWKSILFQFIYAFAVLQMEQLYINNFTLENNVYIKDIFSDPNAIGSWIYKVNNMDYYIPNYGYILLFDSKFTDIDVTEVSDIKKYKIYGKIYGKNSDFDMDSISNLILEQFKSLINPDNFGHTFKLKGGVIPDDSIINLLTRMHNEKELILIKEYIIKYFSEFLHNRIGTLLYKSEKENINNLSKPNFIQGNMMVYRRRYEEYEWVMFVGDDDNLLKKKIICKKGENYEQMSVFSSSLFGYPEYVYPETSKNMKYDETYIYETYNLNIIEK